MSTLSTTVAPYHRAGLGYRITMRFVLAFFGQMFNHPAALFTEEMLRPEMQDLQIFVDGLDNLISAQKRVAQLYFSDGSIEFACPPLRALLHVMRDDNFQGKGLDHPDIRSLFTRESMLASEWYAERLKARQRADIRLWNRHVRSLKAFVAKVNYAEEAERLGLAERSTRAHRESRDGWVCRLSEPAARHHRRPAALAVSVSVSVSVSVQLPVSSVSCQRLRPAPLER